MRINRVIIKVLNEPLFQNILIEFIVINNHPFCIKNINKYFITEISNFTLISHKYHFMVLSCYQVM